MASPHSVKPPAFLKLRSSNTFLLSTVSVAVFTDIFLYSVIVPVIPFALTERAQIPSDQVGSSVSFLIAAYGLALALASPPLGFIADHTQRRTSPFIGGLIVLFGATLMLHLGHSFPVLVAARVLQGISGAVVWIAGLALLADTFNKDEIGQSMGYVFLAMSLGLLLGPLFGGIVFAKAGYNAVFAMAYTFLALDILMRLLAIEKRTARKWLNPGGVDQEPEQSIQLTDMPPAIRDPRDGDLQMMRRRLPSIVTLLKSRRLLVALWGTVVLAVLMTSLDAVLPLYVERTFDWNSMGAGLLFLAIVLPSFLGPFVGLASDRYGNKWLATAGFVLAVPVEVLFRFVRQNKTGQKILLVALLVLLGLSMDLIITPLMSEITLVVEGKHRAGRLGAKGAYAQAYGLFNFSFAVGCLIGPLWGGLILKSAGWDTMTWTLGLLSAISALPTAIWCGGLIFSPKED